MNRSLWLLLSLSACGGTMKGAPLSGDAATSPTSNDGGIPPNDGAALSSDGASALGDAAGPAPDFAPTGVASCTGGMKGTWENITAPPLAADSAVNFAYALDPRHVGTVYLGTILHGIWKTTDCGVHWSGPINTGTTGKDASDPSTPIDASILSGTTGQNANGMNWTMAIDPRDSSIYTVVGYGANGLYKSTDGGVNWNQLLPKSIRDATTNGFVNHLSMDPTNPKHLVADFHVLACTLTAPPGVQLVSQDFKTATISSLTASTPTGQGTSYSGWGCLAETHDAGDTWSLVPSAYPDINGDGPGIQVVNDKTWFFGTQGGNLWRTTVGGATDGKTFGWSQVNLFGSCGNASCEQPVNEALGFVYIASDGSFYSGGNAAVIHSTDGINWTQLSGQYSPALYDLNGSSPIVDDGTTLHVAQTPTMNQYWTAPLSKIKALTSNAPAQVFTQLPVAGDMNSGMPVQLAIDPINHFLYSSNDKGGFWRMKLE